MDLPWLDLLKAIALGLVEGLTELVPVSSEGHRLLVQRLLGIDAGSFGHGFTALTEVGVLTALVAVYFRRLLAIAAGLRSDPAARRFVLGLAIASLPTVVAGALTRISWQARCSMSGSCALH